MAVRVGINGFGTVGKRVADAVSLQDDMEVAGVVKTRPSFEAGIANILDYPLFASTRESLKAFEDKGLKAEGIVENLLDDCDIIIDCTPNKTGAKNKEKLYAPRKMKAVFQGGEKHDLAGLSFNALASYQEALGRQYARVVSCNTTGLIRTLFPIASELGIEQVRAVLIRRGPDPGNDKKGPVNSIIPDPASIPSHHGPDVNTVMPDLDIVTSAVVVPTTIMHTHAVNVQLLKNSDKDEILDMFSRSPRVLPLSTEDGFTSTAKIIEYARDMGRKRSDLQEIAVWNESVNVINSRELFYLQAIHQESDIVPENIDCIRAMMELTKDSLESMRKTDEALGLKKWW